MKRHGERLGLIHPRTGLFVIAFLIVAGGLFWWWDWDPTDPAFGSFDGQVAATWDDDGLNMKLNRDFAYIDPQGRRWAAPTGSIINGASIPRIFWSAIGGPFEGKFRNASVIHDASCEAQAEPWEAVHRMFFDACRCSRVGIGKAQTMYWAVYHFGPRWRQVTSQQHRNSDSGLVTETVIETPNSPPAEIVSKAERYFNKREFTPKQIEDCTVEDIETEVAKWDEANNADSVL